MNGQKKRQTGQKYRAVSVGKLDRQLVEKLRDDARSHHRSLAGHIRAILENALASGGAQ
jgi:plasmid stability protein